MVNEQLESSKTFSMTSLVILQKIAECHPIEIP